MKTSLAPGQPGGDASISNAAGLNVDLDASASTLVGYGCTTCIGNSGPLPDAIAEAVEEGNLVVAAVLSGNRNFEGRVNPHVRANYLASPPLVVAYALLGTHDRGHHHRAAGHRQRRPAGLSEGHLADQRRRSPRRSTQCLTPRDVPQPLRRRVRGPEGVAEHRDGGRARPIAGTRAPPTSRTRPTSTGMTTEPEPLDRHRAAPACWRCWATASPPTTSRPAGSIKKDSPAGEYLLEHQVRPLDFNSYGARRGNHEVMMRGTFANIRIKNELVPGIEGGITKHQPVGRDDADLRRGDALPGRGRAAGDLRRQGIRHRLDRATGRPRAPCCWASRR